MYLKFFLTLFIFFSFTVKACEKPTMPSVDEWNIWLAEVKKEAASKGISQKTIKEYLSDVKHQKKIILRDRCQTESTITLEEYLYYSDLDIFMKGESRYLDMKDMMLEMDSTSVQIQGALDILDSYFEQIALSQFEKEKEKLYHWLMVEFADYFMGEDGRVKVSSSQDKDIQRAIILLHDPVAYENIFLAQ